MQGYVSNDECPESAISIHFLIFARMQNRKFKILLITLVIGLGVALIKLVAYLMSGSVFILSDVLESGVNIFAGAVALGSVYFASKPKDKDHPYGHGKIEFLSSGFEGVLIALAGVLIIIKSIESLINPAELHNIDWGIYLTGLGGVANLVMGLYLQKVGKKTSSPALTANGKHLMSDALSSAAMIGGLVIIYFTDIYWLDPIFASIFGAVILVTGIGVVRKSVAGVMDEADEELIADLVSEINNSRRDSWVDLHNFRIIKYGSSLHIDCHLTLPWYYSLERAHDEIKAFEDLVREKSDREAEIFAHSDPCRPHSCKLCRLQNCRERQHPFEEKVEWTHKTVIQNTKHQL